MEDYISPVLEEQETFVSDLGNTRIDQNDQSYKEAHSGLEMGLNFLKSNARNL